jgi:hypothetical protein
MFFRRGTSTPPLALGQLHDLIVLPWHLQIVGGTSGVAQAAGLKIQQRGFAALPGCMNAPNALWAKTLGTVEVTHSSTKKFPTYNRLRASHTIFTHALQNRHCCPPATFFAVLALSQFTYYK